MTEYLSKWHKRKKKEDIAEETLILNSLYKPNDIVFYQGRGFKVMYAEVRNGELGYMLEGRKNWYFVRQGFLVSDQI